MKAAACSCRVSTYFIFEVLRASMRSSVSSPGMPKIYSTPSFSRHFTSSSEALMLSCLPSPEEPCAAGLSPLGQRPEPALIFSFLLLCSERDIEARENTLRIGQVSHDLPDRPRR